ncbi:FUSC family protein [Jatrophihabitans sp. DSM 45814]
MPSSLTRAVQWLGTHDRNYAALRRAGRTAIVMPAMFALGDEVIGNPVLATFAAFGSFAMLLLVDFSGPMRERLQAQAGLVVVCGVFITLGTLASRNAWLAAASMAVVAFGVIFAGVASSVLASATTSLLLAFILPVSLAGPPSSIPDRLAGWGLAGAASIIAIAVLWPAPTRDPLRRSATAACRSLATLLRAEVDYALSARDDASALDRERALEQAREAVNGLQRGFLATPYRPTGLSTPARTVVRLVDQMNWLNAIVIESTPSANSIMANPTVCEVKIAAAAVLEAGAESLDATGGNDRDLQAALAQLSQALTKLESDATTDLPSRWVPTAVNPSDANVSDLVTALDPSFRAQELSFAVSLMADTIDLTAAAERRTWWERLIGRQPIGVGGALASAQERVTAHVDRHSVWLHNSVRGAIALAAAVFIADSTGVQHSFWVIFGTLSVLRSNALNTGQNVLRAILGTLIGFILGSALLALIGTNTTTLWILLPIVVLFAGIAPAAISFTAGQVAFTLVIIILFNLIAPAGWRVGLVRIEDVALGCTVSLVVGLLFWPRGARAALRRALAEAYTDSAAYLVDAIDFGMLRCDASAPTPAVPDPAAIRAAAASRRLDDAFRNYLAETGMKPVSLADTSVLLSGVAGLRITADAVMDLWHRDDGQAPGERGAARLEVLQTTQRVTRWYDDLANSLLDRNEVREPVPPDDLADVRLVEALRRDLAGDHGSASATAIRMIWTADHIDAARRLQRGIATPARTAIEHSVEHPFDDLLPAAITQRLRQRRRPLEATEAN